jgi:hypothetical protein
LGRSAFCPVVRLRARAERGGRGGFTPLDRAIQGGHGEIAALLAARLQTVAKRVGERGAAAKQALARADALAGWRRVLEAGERAAAATRGTAAASARGRGGGNCPLAGGRAGAPPAGGGGGFRAGCIPEAEIDFCDLDEVGPGPRPKK